ncbi:MAG: 6-bladed beta-propeller [Prevotellaceae bacterium]|jgi:hypothetical protein|nr:6-bladed beta-propeller [Prevotellaceae bacterium]
MKIKNLILLTSLFLAGSHAASPQSKTGNLPVFDISKKYPEKKIRLQDIADIEYVPLETTDDILLSDKAVLSYVSDKYILVHEPQRGDIFVFNRNGEIHSHFNHKGQSGWEYSWIGDAGTIFDEKNEEIYVCSQSVQVYSLSGDHKRTLKINTLHYGKKVFNLDDEALLVYDDVIVDPYSKSKPETNPYSLVSKKDGSTISVLDIHLSERYSTRFAEILENNRWRPTYIYYTCSMYYGHDFVIADISSDTLYLLTQNRKLTPLLTRKPSVHSSAEPRTIWATLLTTDKFILIGKIPLVFKRGGRIPVLMYEFETGETSEMSILDAEFDVRRWGPGNSPAMTKNMTAELIQAPSIIDAYKKKQLKGNVEKFAATLDEDDNPVVRIIKFGI